MNTETVLDTYKRYLQTFKDKDSDLFSNYAKIREFINTNCHDDLWFLMMSHCIGENVREIEKRGFKVKDQCPIGWDTSVTKKGYQLIKNMQKHKEDFDNTVFMVNFYKFAHLAHEQNPYLQLYLWFCYNQMDKRLLGTTLREVEESAKGLILIERLSEHETSIGTSTEAEQIAEQDNAPIEEESTQSEGNNTSTETEKVSIPQGD